MGRPEHAARERPLGLVLLVRQKRQRNKPADIKGLAARSHAVKALSLVLRGRQYLDDALHEARTAGLSGPDRAFAHAIVATSLRRRGQIDDVLKGFLVKPLPAKSGLTREVLHTGVAQMLFMDIPPHAAIDMAVRIARHDRAGRHFAGLVNAVLRRVAETGPEIAAGQDAAMLNVPDWMLTSWTAGFGAAAARQCAEASLCEAALDVSVKSDPQRWAGELGGEALPTGTVRVVSADRRVADMAGYADGAWWVQDAAAALPVKLLGDVAGKRVLDLCAAPGGKTAQLAGAGADVTAVDNSEDRLERLRVNMRRLGLAPRIVCGDAATLSDSDRFDAVIADVPCSATGTLRRHPDGLHLKTPDMAGRLRPVQLAVLRNAVALTRPGGTIIYCACSLETGECEDVIEEFLAADDRVERAGVQADELPGCGNLINAAGELRVQPWQSIGTATGLDGFFAARLLKV